MPTLPFGRYAPDLSELDGQTTRSLKNVMPRADGYGPLRDLEEWTQSLPDRCRGSFYARKSDGSVAIFGATDTDLYLMNNTSFAWDVVSQSGGPYTTLNADEHWQFAQFNNFVIAVQANVAPQVFDTSEDTEFSDLGGSPPQARYIAIVNRFALLFGLTANPFRAQWSGLNDVSSSDAWTSGVNSSDFQDLPDGGLPRGVQGGDLGFIIQDSALRRMTFQPGSDVVFSIDKIAKDVGCIAPNAIINVGGNIFFIAAIGFMQLDNQGGLTPIGDQVVTATFLKNFDVSGQEFLLGAADPNANTIMWVYRSKGGSADAFDSALLYNTVLKQWAPASYSGEFISSIATPGLTLEALDAIAPGAQVVTGAANNGSGKVRLTVGSTSGMTTGDFKTISGVVGTTEANGTFAITVHSSTTIDLATVSFVNAYVSGGVVGGSLDLLPFSLDSVSLSSLPNLSIVSTDHKIGYLTGDTLEATLETPEQSADGRRMLVNQLWPLTDASIVFGYLQMRENQSDAFTKTPEAQNSSNGSIPQLWSTRYARGGLRIPAGTAWTYAVGIRPEAQDDGEI